MVDPGRKGAGSPNGFSLSKCMSAQEKRTSDATQLLVTTEEQLIMSQLKCQALTLAGHCHCSVVLMGLDMVLQVFQGLNDNWIDFFPKSGHSHQKQHKQKPFVWIPIVWLSFFVEMVSYFYCLQVHCSSVRLGVPD